MTPRTSIRVRLGGTLMSKVPDARGSGAQEFQVEAATIREMLDMLAAAHPELAPLIERGVSVAINGTVYREAFLTPIPEGSEVYLLPQLVGG